MSEKRAMNAGFMLLLALMLPLIAGCEDKSKCRVCDGRGVVSVWQPNGGYQKALCMECLGTGDRFAEQERKLPEWRRGLIALCLAVAVIAGAFKAKGSKEGGTDGSP